MIFIIYKNITSDEVLIIQIGRETHYFYLYSSPKAKEVTMILHYSTEGSLSFKSISSESLVVA